MNGAGWYIRLGIVCSAAVWLPLWCWVSSSVLPGFFERIALIGAGLIVGISWVVYTVAWPGVLCYSRRAAVWMAVPATPLLAWAMDSASLPLMMRVRASEADLMRVVQSPELAHKRAGSFDVVRTHRRGTAILITTGFEWLNEGGVAFCPYGPPEENKHSPYSYGHLYGAWHWFVIRD